MKTTIFALCFLCIATASFAQVGAVLNSQAQPFEMPSHAEHAAQHSMAPEANLYGDSPYSYAKGEVPLSELASPIYHTPLGDIAREYRKEHALQPKATRVFEK